MRVACASCWAVLLAGSLVSAKLPFDEATDHIHPDCWAPDYCNAEQFRYKLCKLRLRKRPGAKADEYSCGEGEFCEEVDCPHKCWLPPKCWCETEGDLAGRMLCTEGECFSHPSTQWGLCVPIPPDWEETADEDEPLPVPFHFYTPDELLHNARIHINEDSPMKGVMPTASKDEL